MSQSLIVNLINQLFDLEKKIEDENSDKILRNIKRMRRYLEEAGWNYHNPIGENYDETRTDCDADIAGESSENLVITEVIKPIIFQKESMGNMIVQKGVVIAQAK